MSTPSNPSGIPSLPVIGLLAVILFLGLALAPRAFEFRAWPEPSRHTAVEQIVDRPVAPVTEVQVAGVEASSEDHEEGARVERGAVAERRPEAQVREAEPTRPAPERTPGVPRSPAPAPAEPETVVETPVLPAPVEQPPAQPAQLAELPQADQTLRPEAGELAPEEAPASTFEARERRALDARGHKGRGHGGHGAGRGHRAHRGRGKH